VPKYLLIFVFIYFIYLIFWLIYFISILFYGFFFFPGYQQVFFRSPAFCALLWFLLPRRSFCFWHIFAAVSLPPTLKVVVFLFFSAFLCSFLLSVVSRLSWLLVLVLGPIDQLVADFARQRAVCIAIVKQFGAWRNTSSNEEDIFREEYYHISDDDF